MITFSLGPSINGLITDRNTKICCQGFVLAGFIQSTTASGDFLPISRGGISAPFPMENNHLFSNRANTMSDFPN